MEKSIGTFKKREPVEQRRHERFEVQDGAFASLSLQFAVLGQIANISKGGLAFRYVASRPRSKEYNRLNILLTDRSFFVDKLPFDSIWDIAIPQDFSFGPIAFRHCGVKFGPLESTQKLDLGYFTESYSL
ncbi:MAG: hypothetical protein JRF28_12015 [Deltaproteobacteria bacterium]|nr:hypothetical protein [Deltaproteobacteria bacterium]